MTELHKAISFLRPQIRTAMENIRELSNRGELAPPPAEAYAQKLSWIAELPDTYVLPEDYLSEMNV